MAIRRGHGTGKASPLRVEVLPPDEQKPGVAAPQPVSTGPIPRRRGGQFTPLGARQAGAEGGRRSAQLRTMARTFASALKLAPAELSTFESHSLVKPFVEEAERWLEAKIAEVARDVGGGEVSAGVVSILRSAAWSTYMSRYLYELATGARFGLTLEGTGDSRRVTGVNLQIIGQASRLSDQGRQHLLAAHELARLEAISRKASAKPDGVAALTAAANALVRQDESVQQGAPNTDRDDDDGGEERDA